jgi:hypothetical protein
VVSVSPQEWCDPDSAGFKDVKYYRFETYVWAERPFYLPLKKEVPLGCLPETVFQILEGGQTAVLRLSTAI